MHEVGKTQKSSEIQDIFFIKQAQMKLLKGILIVRKESSRISF